MGWQTHAYYTSGSRSHLEHGLQAEFVELVDERNDGGSQVGGAVISAIACRATASVAGPC